MGGVSLRTQGGLSYTKEVRSREVVAVCMFLDIRELEQKSIRFEQALPVGVILFDPEFEQQSPLTASGIVLLEQGRALCGRRFLVHEKANGAVPFMNGFRPFRG